MANKTQCGTGENCRMLKKIVFEATVNNPHRVYSFIKHGFFKLYQSNSEIQESLKKESGQIWQIF